MADATTPAAYAPLTHVRQVYDRTVPHYDYGAVGQAGFPQWQAELRAKVAALLGGFSAPRGDLAPQVLATVEKDGYTQQRSKSRVNRACACRSTCSRPSPVRRPIPRSLP